VTDRVEPVANRPQIVTDRPQIPAGYLAEKRLPWSWAEARLQRSRVAFGWVCDGSGEDGGALFQLSATRWKFPATG
jgi:hypothetical protein